MGFFSNLNREWIFAWISFSIGRKTQHLLNGFIS